ncbi:MAG TPA: CehA/McbA family metallohydrolase, partial [bacterium]|nr:CehA/McbA family metallohydrolase [bacterium]
MRRPTSLALAVSLVLVLASTAGSAARYEGAASSGSGGRPVAYYLLTIVVQDGTTGEEVPARCSIVGNDQEPAYPVPPQSGFYHAPYANAPGYFYTRGRSTVFVPEGPTSIFITRGFEHETVTDTVDVTCDTTFTVHVDRWIDMSESGFYSGDCHTHAHHSGGIYTVEPADALFIAQAEGLNVINCLDNEYFFTGGPDICSTEDCIVYMCEEHRSCVYGHSGLLGIGIKVLPATTSWWPLLADVADEVHTQEGAAIISAHPITTTDFFDLDTIAGKMLARELPLDVTRYKIDGYELLSGTFDCQGIALWHRILNCGFRLPACSGTDSCLNAGSGRPPGGYRTYAQVLGEFTYDSWLSSLVAGRTFVTNGPLFTRFEVRDFAMGDSV